MKKIGYLLLIGAISILLVVSGGSISTFAQKSNIEKKPKRNAEIEKVQREKFDPTRNATEDLQNAIVTAQKDNKRIILDVGGEWCVWCRIMDFYLIENPDIAKLRDDNFVWLKVNMSPENENTEFLSAYPEILGYPHLFVLEADGKFLHSQFTGDLEEGKSYNKQKFTDFLNKWSPIKQTEKAEK